MTKFITLVKEDTYGEEKFINGDLSSAVAYEDYISSDASEGQIGDPEPFEKTDSTVLKSGGAFTEVETLQRENSLSALIGLKGLTWVLESIGDIVFDQPSYTLSDMEEGETALCAITSAKNDSFTYYTSTIYDNAVKYALGNQINELSFSLEDGETAIEITNYADNHILDETNLNRGLSNYLGDFISFSNFKGIAYKNVLMTDGSVNLSQYHLAPGEWTDILCPLKSGDFSANFNLDDESKSKFCATAGYENGEVEVTAEVTLNQINDTFNRLAYNDSLEQDGIKFVSLVIRLEDDDYLMEVYIPKGAVSLDGSNLKTESEEETMTVTAEEVNVLTAGYAVQCLALVTLFKKVTS